MAILKGPGAFTDVNLIAVQYDKSMTKNGKSAYLDMQIDAQDKRGPNQTSLHLVSDRQKDAEGNVRWNNGAPYSTDQLNTIKEAAGDNTIRVKNVDGEEIGTAYALKASIMKASRGNGLVINTVKPMGPSDFKLDESTMDNQYASMSAASAAAKEKKAEAKAAEAEAPAPAEPEVAAPAADEPELVG